MAQTFAVHTNEVGKIRIGCQVPIAHGKNSGKPRPEKLKQFRLTSSNKPALERAATRYGGTVQDWTIRPAWKDLVRPPDHAYELYTETDTLDILLRADSLMQSCFEQWEGPYCVLRCDGQYIVKDAKGDLAGHPCLCSADPKARQCTEVSRIGVILEGLTYGRWRLDTHGFYAPAEIRGFQVDLEGLALDRLTLPGRMRLEWRTDHKMVQGDKQTLHYAVVVIEPRLTSEQLLMASAEQRLLRLPPNYERQKSLAQHLFDLYGPPAPGALPAARGILPPAETPADWIPQIEAAIVAKQGSLDKLETWWRWAEKQRGTARTAFAAADYAHMLSAIQAVEVKPSPPPDPNWREGLLLLAANIREGLEGKDDLELLQHGAQLCERAMRAAEHAETTDAEGAALVDELRKLGELLAQPQMGLAL